MTVEVTVVVTVLAGTVTVLVTPVPVTVRAAALRVTVTVERACVEGGDELPVVAVPSRLEWTVVPAEADDAGPPITLSTRDT